MHPTVHCSTVYNTQAMEAAWNSLLFQLHLINHSLAFPSSFLTPRSSTLHREGVPEHMSPNSHQRSLLYSTGPSAVSLAPQEYYLKVQNRVYFPNQ